MQEKPQWPFEGWLIRCPRLGGEVDFPYCAKEGGGLPCRHIVRCWQAAFPVEDYLKDLLSAEDWERFCCEAPKERLASLVEILEGLGKGRKDG